MKSCWVLLLLLLLARAQPGASEGDPLPESLVDLVRNSAISSVDDLKLLLQRETNAIEEEEEEEEEEDEHDVLSNQTHGRFARSLVEAPMAQLASCQTRTEVMEVTRSMVDRRNANFLVWPLCVEVTRCSGCCNSRNMKCVPAVTSTRYLQVLKIMFVNRKEHYERAIISVEDHVSCRCQSPSSSSSSRINHPPPPPPPPLPLPTPSSHLPHLHNPSPPKAHASKADLHRHDDLKHNQHHIKKPLMGEGRQWQHGGYTQLVHWTPVHPKMEVEGRSSEARSVTSIGSGEEGGANNNKGDPIERRQIMHHQHPQSDAPSPPETPTHPPRLEEKPTVPMTTSQKTVVVGSVKNNEREESGSANSGGSGGAEVAKEKDLKETSGGDLTLTEEAERRKKVLEMIQTEPHLHPHLPQQRPKPEAVKTALSSSPPSSSPPASFPPRLASTPEETSETQTHQHGRHQSHDHVERQEIVNRTQSEHRRNREETRDSGKRLKTNAAVCYRADFQGVVQLHGFNKVQIL
ncbi:hypothetical protein CesoFtcFv8_008252 [Champsocephalus esox]|uniref:Platelet-derived growth factor (PDGF) family profile domain-containing protein n=1 Tax=Champsocephalus esox TaxID=159716 RepID=A0AAN8H159_9TELE|nr:hypothetical protein CesoFtcFv8_008252 [Champsocephalus esox]